MVGLLLAGFILWLSSPLIAEFFEYVKDNALYPVGEWLRDLFGPELGYTESTRPFVVSEYLTRIEKASLDILESRKPTDKTIVLWFGLDGLRLNEDGAMKWVSRKKKPTEAVFYQSCRSIRPIRTGMLLVDQTQCTRAQMEAMMNQCQVSQMQSWQSMQMANAIQQCCVQYPAQYPPYYYGGYCENYLG